MEKETIKESNINCKSCIYFFEPLPKFLKRPDVIDLKIIGECMNRNVVFAFCVSYGTTCNEKYYEKK